ncbi:MAG: DegT/DnrJ/EryC1/StrS family aminotransferase [Rhodobacteraceae bacterium]|nr:DegT/DnrJ/EryC1/StrS family aminotransferase [Paracoccaceae bacterium]
MLDSGRLTAGPMMSRFEQAMADSHDCAHGLMCNSGTSALQIALAALKERHGWQDGDEVLVPAVTFVASSNVVMYNGLKPVFVDVEPDYYEIDPALIEARITPRTRAIMPVHLAGHPCDMTPIMEIAERHGLRVVEDSCETMFARDHGRAVGSFGDVGCFSTYVAHIINTGVGGLCTTNDAELLVMLKSLMNHGRDSIYIRMDDDQGQDDDGLFRIVDRRFSFTRLGHSFRCTEMEAAIGVAEFERHAENIGRRNAIAQRLTQGLAGLESHLQLPTERPGAERVFMFYPIVIRDDAINRDDLILYLEKHGVETRYLLPLINQPAYRTLFGNLDADYPVAAWLNANAFYVGCHPQLSDGDVDTMIEVFHKFFS